MKAKPFTALFVVLCFALTPALAIAQSQAIADPLEAEIREFERMDHVHAPQSGAVLFVGSSSIRYWDSINTDFPGVRLVRRGFGGSQIRDVTRFAARIVVPYHPRLIVLYAGDNDLATGRSPDEVCRDFIAFVQRVRGQQPDVAIAFVAIKPSPARIHLLDASRAANLKIRAYAETHDNLRFIDVFAPMLDAESKPRAELFLDDRLHMNRAGYQIWIERLTPLLREFAEPSR